MTNEGLKIRPRGEPLRLPAAADAAPLPARIGFTIPLDWLCERIAATRRKKVAVQDPRSRAGHSGPSDLSLGRDGRVGASQPRKIAALFPPSGSAVKRNALVKVASTGERASRSCGTSCDAHHSILLILSLLV